MKKITKTLLIILGISAFTFILSFFLYPGAGYSQNNTARDVLGEVYFFTGLLTGLVFLVMLFKKKWRKEYIYIPFAIGFACVISVVMLMWDGIHITFDPQKQVTKCVHKFMATINADYEIRAIEKIDSNTYDVEIEYENGIKPTADEIIRSKKASLFDIKRNGGKCRVKLNGKWNQGVYVKWSKNVVNSGLSTRDIELLKKGNIDHPAEGHDEDSLSGLTDQMLLKASQDGRFERYLELLRNVAATTILKVSKFL